MRNQEKNDKLSISEMLKKIQEQAMSMPDEEGNAPASEDTEVQREERGGTRYRFRVTKRKRSEIAEGEQPQSELMDAFDEILSAPDAEENLSETAENAAITLIGEDAEEDEEDEDLMDADTRPIDTVPAAEPAPVKTMEFEAVEEKDDSLERLRRALEIAEPGEGAEPEAQEPAHFEELYAEESAYLPHGAQAQRQDTGDVTYVFDGKSSEEGEGDFEEELVPPEVDETDVNLMIAFGMDDELAKTIDSDRREQVEQEISDMEREMEEEAEEEEVEYTSAAQNKSIFAEYRKKYGSITLKLAVCAVLLLIAFLYENITVFGGTLADAIHPEIYPVTHIMIDLQLVLLGGALIWRRLKDGILSLVRFKPTPDSMIALLTLLTVIYDVGVCFLPYGTRPYLYGFPMLMGIMAALVFELFNLRREIFSFNIVASKRIKFTVGRLDAEQARAELEALGEYLPEDPSFFKLNKTSFVDGFFRKMRPSGSNRRILRLLLSFSVALSAAMVGLGALWTGNLFSGVTVGYACLLMCTPMALYLTYSLPFYRASRIAYEQDSAILGEGAIDEYSEASSITFDDRDVFPSYGVKVRSIKVFGNNRIDSIIYHAASVFRIAGGPLADVFDIATAELGHSEDVRLLAVENDGIEAMVSGTHLHFGKDEYLRRHGFAPMVDDDDGQVGSAGIMYMVCDDEVAAKMYIQYRIDPDFEATLKQLYRYGICVGIKTLDPNIDDEMLARRIKLDRYPVRILKCSQAEDNTKVLERADSRLVSKHSAKALLKAFTLCSKVQRMIRLDSVINVISLFIGVVIMLVSLVLGGAGQIPSVYVALYQLFWAVPMMLLGRMMIQ